MDVSSVAASMQNAQNLQELYSYLVPTSQTTDTSASDLFSAALNQNQTALSASSSSQNSSNANYLQMLQALETSASNNSSSPFLQAPNGTNTTDLTNSYLSMLDSATANDPLFQATDSSTNNLSLLQALQGNENPGSIAASMMGGSVDGSTPFDSNYAIIEALASSGMSGTQMNQVLSNLQLGTQYTQQGNLSAGSDSTGSGLFSSLA